VSTRDERFDLAVVGAGPAGSACALAAARLGLRVALFDPCAETLEKPCGEGLMPAGVEALVDLGLERVLDHAHRFEGLRWCAPGATPLELDLPASGFALRRTVLQGALDAELSLMRGVTRFRARARARHASGGFEVRADPACVAAGALAICDGLSGGAAPWLQPASRGRSGRLGLRAHFCAAREIDRVEVHIGRAVEVYLTPLPDGVVNAAALYSRRPRGVHGAEALLERALAACPDARARLGRRLDAAAARSLATRRPAALAARGAFLVGDAGGGVDPVLGCGVTVALRTGIAAARAAHAIARGARQGMAEGEYALFYRREVGARRRLAGLLREASRSAVSARAALAVARLVPGLARSWTAAAAFGGERPASSEGSR
jgi:flavin-dependent dehydrogenase